MSFGCVCGMVLRTGSIATLQVAGAPKITGMVASKSGLQLLVNGADRGIRLFEIRADPLEAALASATKETPPTVEAVKASLLTTKVPWCWPRSVGQRS